LKQDLQAALGKIKGSIVESLITSVMRDATRLGKVYYGKELKALAERSGKRIIRTKLPSVVFTSKLVLPEIISNLFVH
jgi:hypothetical protein